MEKKFDKLLADRPAARELIRAYLYLQATIGHAYLEDVQTDIKLAALHLEEALRFLRAAAEEHNQ